MKVLLLLLFSTASFASPFVQSIARQEIIAHGKNAYMFRCSGCHGEKGDGLGPAAQFLDPKPRDFTSGIFKFRSSPLGTLPSDQDLMTTISRGIPNSSMPSFADVSEQERFAIVEYIKTFSPAWNDPSNFDVAVIGAPFPEEDFKDFSKFIVRAKKGKELFIESCVLCHGNNGYGDGEGGVDLLDDWDQPIVPANLTKLTIKSGKSVKDIYRILLTGVNGTPMSSYKDVYSDDALWDLTAWVLYLRGLENGVYDENNPPIAPIADPQLISSQDEVK
ncbi:MAG: c-type cytochrome [Bacteriovoracaceae bacterium]